MAEVLSTPRVKTPRKSRVTLTLAAPEAKSVFVAGSFCDWDQGSQPLKRDRSGAWKVTLSLLPGRYEYRFLVDGEWRDDPKCAERVPNSFGTENCVLTVGGRAGPGEPHVLLESFEAV